MVEMHAHYILPYIGMYIYCQAIAIHSSHVDMALMHCASQETARV